MSVVAEFSLLVSIYGQFPDLATKSLASDPVGGGVGVGRSVLSTVLYCTVLYCTVLYCTVLYCTDREMWVGGCWAPGHRYTPPLSSLCTTPHRPSSPHIVHGLGGMIMGRRKRPRFQIM